MGHCWRTCDKLDKYYYELEGVTEWRVENRTVTDSAMGKSVLMI